MKLLLQSARFLLCCTALAGPVSAQLQIIRQGRDSYDQRDPGEKHGQTVATGDFNGDGFGDLATGAPGEKPFGSNPGPESGIVVMSYGSARGIKWTGAWRLTPRDSPQVPSNDDAFSFGGALAAADFNNDGYDDLAVGARVKGMVFVYYGSTSGLGGVSYLFRREDFGTPTDATHLFGGALAAGSWGATASMISSSGLQAMAAASMCSRAARPA